jgi:type 1 glutamine amidotransferase
MVAFAAADARPEVPADWARQVAQAAPARATAPLRHGAPRVLLVFSLATGYQHSVIPYVDEMFAIVGRKSGAFTTTVSRDIEDLATEQLSRYDVLVLNNTCSVGPRRNLLLDVLETDPRYADLTAEERQAKAARLEQGLLEYVRGGKGLVVMHGAPTLLNNSAEFTRMVGGAFDYHPPSQQVTVRVVDPDHPLAAAFRDHGPLVHRDEPYCFRGAYDDRDFCPLLAFDTQGVTDPQGRFDDQVRYAAWIRTYGAGRVFFCSPGHYADSYTNPVLLRFVLDGTQYAAGDLECDDSTRQSQ